MRVVRTHALSHVSELRVDPAVLEARFAAGCSTAHCNAGCCRAGVDADVVERDRILAHAGLIQRHMDPQQEADPASWFDAEAFADADMPSGFAVTTKVRHGACVFLNRESRCVLQIASAEAGDGTDLKPFFCHAYPLTLDEGMLTLDPHLATRPECCAQTSGGGATVFEACATELRFMLGEHGVRALRTPP